MCSGDQGEGERVDVGLVCDAAQFTLVGQVGGNRGRGLGEDRDVASGGDLPQPCDQWLALLPTIGGLTPLPPDKTASIFDTVGTTIDTLGGHFTMQYTTLATTAVRAGTF